MLKPKSREILLLLLAPSLALGLGAFFHWRRIDESGTPVLVAAIAATGALSAVLAFMFLQDALRLRRALSHLRRGGGGFSAFGKRDDASDEQARNQVARLRREVDRLSAVRDLALVANDGVDRELVLEKALTVIEGLVDAHDIRIFLSEPQAEGALEPIALRTKGQTRIRKNGEPPLGFAPRRAAKALQARRRIGELGPSGLAVATLLVADGEVIGALEVATPRRGRNEAWANEVEDDLDLLAKHVALAIRKPALYDRAVSDGLTGLGTKRHFAEQARLLIAQARRLGTPLSIVVLDIDHFKRVNDVHGHVAGDAVLAEVANRLRATIRGYDLAFRYGGEELVVLSPNTRLDEALSLAERLRRSVARAPIKAGNVDITVTASFGVAVFGAPMEDVSALVAAADKELYVAKREGRNQVRPLAAPQAPQARSKTASVQMARPKAVVATVQPPEPEPETVAVAVTETVTETGTETLTEAVSVTEPVAGTATVSSPPPAAAETSKEPVDGDPSAEPPPPAAAEIPREPVDSDRSAGACPPPAAAETSKEPVDSDPSAEPPPPAAAEIPKEPLDSDRSAEPPPPPAAEIPKEPLDSDRSAEPPPPAAAEIPREPLDSDRSAGACPPPPPAAEESPKTLPEPRKKVSLKRPLAEKTPDAPVEAQPKRRKEEISGLQRTIAALHKPETQVEW